MNHPFPHGRVLDRHLGADVCYCRKCGNSHRALATFCDGLRGGYTESDRAALAPVVEEMAARGREQRRFELVKAALSGVIGSDHHQGAIPANVADRAVRIADAVMARLGQQ